MRCPSCLSELQVSTDACPTCKFSLERLDKKFGTVPKIFRYMTDMSAFYTERERTLTETALKDMERTFPGLYVSVMTMEVHPRFNLREYLFWLVNRCNFSPLESRLERCFSLVLFFDARSKTALLTTGYGLQAALPEEKLTEILNSVLPDFSREFYYPGTMTILEEIRRQLKKYCATGLLEPAPELVTRLATGRFAVKETP